MIRTWEFGTRQATFLVANWSPAFMAMCDAAKAAVQQQAAFAAVVETFRPDLRGANVSAVEQSSAGFEVTLEHPSLTVQCRWVRKLPLLTDAQASEHQQKQMSALLAQRTPEQQAIIDAMPTMQWESPPVAKCTIESPQGCLNGMGQPIARRKFNIADKLVEERIYEWETDGKKHLMLIWALDPFDLTVLADRTKNPACWAECQPGTEQEARHAVYRVFSKTHNVTSDKMEWQIVDDCFLKQMQASLRNWPNVQADRIDRDALVKLMNPETP